MLVRSLFNPTPVIPAKAGTPLLSTDCGGGVGKRDPRLRGGDEVFFDSCREGGTA